MASETSVKTTNWRLVEVGRIVLVENKLATIVEIIDQKRALIDGPAIQRQAISLGKTILTPLVLDKLPRGARTSTVTKRWAAADIDAKWGKTTWAKKNAQKQRRAKLTDFERFQVMVLKKQRNFAVRKALAKA
ncbi:DEKNAAC103857 [Brettanomyces naardenensis]|uniref:DEKNAAC103857 n=1 Tax=Brettanomyces naardenensis TaxID=13370 RepID=A0A448YPC6_BRENA|nr:DEKNAAC103857 [Brettanomyces naardenensis]